MEILRVRETEHYALMRAARVQGLEEGFRDGIDAALNMGLFARIFKRRPTDGGNR